MVCAAAPPPIVNNDDHTSGPPARQSVPSESAQRNVGSETGPAPRDSLGTNRAPSLHSDSDDGKPGLPNFTGSDDTAQQCIDAADDALGNLPPLDSGDVCGSAPIARAPLLRKTHGSEISADAAHGSGEVGVHLDCQPAVHASQDFGQIFGEAK